MSSSSEPSKSSKRYSSEELEKDVLKLLDENPHGLNINQIAQQLDINRNTVSKWLKTLEAKNKIISRKMGVSNLYYKAENSDDIFPGPYVITIEKSSNNYFVRNVNNNYLKRFNEIRENLIGNDLFKFSPFIDYREQFYLLLSHAIESLSDNSDSFTEKIDLRSSDDKLESYRFKIDHFKDKDNQFTFNFQDLTLLKLTEEQLLNSDSISKILDLFLDCNVAIVSDDSKVIMANKKTISDFNNDIDLEIEPVYCYDLFNTGLAGMCENCIGKLAIESNQIQEDSITINGKNYNRKAIPIESTETKLKGYILVLTKK